MSPAPRHFDVVAFGAHPDDVEMGMAGTIACLTRAGRSALLVSLTRGEAGTHGSPAVRAEESAAAARVLRAEAMILGFPDTGVEDTGDARLRIARIIREHTPSLVFAPYHTNPGTHHDGRANRDHMATGTIVRDALKLARFQRLLPELNPHDVRRILYYMVPAGTPPTLVVDVSAEEETIRGAIEAYASQMAITRRGNSIQEILTVWRRSTGISIGKRLGEAFLSDEPLEAGPEELTRI